RGWDLAARDATRSRAPRVKISGGPAARGVVHPGDYQKTAANRGESGFPVEYERQWRDTNSFGSVRGKEAGDRSQETGAGGRITAPFGRGSESSADRTRSINGCIAALRRAVCAKPDRRL